MEAPPGLDELESEPLRRTPILVAAAVLVAAAGVLVAATGGDGSPKATAPPGPAPTPTPSVSSVARVTHLGVLFEPLSECTRVSGNGHIHAAMAVTDFSARPVRVLAAAAAGSTPGLQVVAVRLGQRPCGGGGSAAPVAVEPWQDMVVDLDIATATHCPPDSFGLRVTFDTHDGIRYAESSSVVDITHLPGCR